jgi:hypothetical protein
MPFYERLLHELGVCVRQGRLKRLSLALVQALVTYTNYSSIGQCKTPFCQREKLNGKKAYQQVVISWCMPWQVIIG